MFGLAFMLIVLNSCDNDSDSSVIDANLSDSNVEIATEFAEIDDTSENINEIIEGAYLEIASTDFFKSSEYKNQQDRRFLSDCVLISKELKEDYMEIILDYGDGCTTKKGHTAKGKIVIHADLNIKNAVINMDYNFDNFYINDRKIEGEVNKRRFFSNENGNRESIIKRDIKIIWEDGSFSTVKGERIREWIEGDENEVWSDNVYSITGSWAITRKNGSVSSETIIEPLIRNLACKFIISGVVEIKTQDKTSQLNYGDGTCDDLAILTNESGSVEIHINRKKRN